MAFSIESAAAAEGEGRRDDVGSRDGSGGRDGLGLAGGVAVTEYFTSYSSVKDQYDDTVEAISSAAA